MIVVGSMTGWTLGILHRRNMTGGYHKDKMCALAVILQWTQAKRTTCSHPSSSHTNALSCNLHILSRCLRHTLAFPADALSLS